jgi:bifunctional non-homologous end joining protein LigD
MSTETATLPEPITLYYREGSSDKVYQCSIEPEGPGYVVAFAYGRRGGTLQTGMKTAEPVDLESATAIFNKLVREKTAKGYTPGESGTPYQHTEKKERFIGILPQLLNAVDESAISGLISDDNWWVQEKFNGKRVLIRKDHDQITGINRKGLVIDLPAPIVEAIRGIDQARFLLDGECVGDTFIAFDLLKEATLDLASTPYHVRYLHLIDLMETASSDSIRYVETATAKKEKEEFLALLRKQNKEGIVFKNKAAIYTPGRPASGGDWLKFKFCATASCIVAGTNSSKRSVKLELIDDARRVGVGNVTIPPNQTVPARGSIVEIRYLYAYPGGSLFQPVYLGKRDDVDLQACSIRQLKFKPTESDEN